MMKESSAYKIKLSVFERLQSPKAMKKKGKSFQFSVFGFPCVAQNIER